MTKTFIIEELHLEIDVTAHIKTDIFEDHETNTKKAQPYIARKTIEEIRLTTFQDLVLTEIEADFMICALNFILLKKKVTPEYNSLDEWVELIPDEEFNS